MTPADSLPTGGSQRVNRPRQHWQEPTVPLMEQSFAGVAGPADPGNAKRRRAFWVVAVILIALVTGAQQLAVMAHGGAKPVPTVEPVEPDAKKPKAPLGDDFDPTDLMGRIATKMFHAFDSDADAKAQLGPRVGEMVDPSQVPDMAAKVRLVPSFTEVTGVESGRKAIGDLRAELEKQKSLTDKERTALGETLDDLDELYANGSASLDAAKRERLEQRLGWQGRLALSFDLPEENADRASLTGSGAALLVFLVCVGLGAVGVFFAGIGMFIWALVLIGGGRLRWRLARPMPGGSLGVEVLTVFLAAFFGLKVVLSLVAAAADAGWLGAWFKAQGEDGMTIVALIAQWLILPLVVLYPRMAGYPAGRVKRAMGWHRGEGFAREVLAGIGGYLACVPLYIIGVLIALVLSVIEAVIRKSVTGHEPPAPVNPIGEMLVQSWWVALLVAVLATVWAPIVEESVFRGGLFRQLSARMAAGWAALISGTVFAMMHGYSASLFPPLIALGAGFALIRAWRGSLVACVTAHALHNGTLMVLMIVMFSLLK